MKKPRVNSKTTRRHLLNSESIQSTDILTRTKEETTDMLYTERETDEKDRMYSSQNFKINLPVNAIDYTETSTNKYQYLDTREQTHRTYKSDNKAQSKNRMQERSNSDFIKKTHDILKTEQFKINYTSKKDFNRYNIGQEKQKVTEFDKFKGENGKLKIVKNHEELEEIDDDIRYVSDNFFSSQVSNCLLDKNILEGVKKNQQFLQGDKIVNKKTVSKIIFNRSHASTRIQSTPRLPSAYDTSRHVSRQQSVTQIKFEQKPLKAILHVKQSNEIANELEEALIDQTKTSKMYSKVFKLKNNRGREFINNNPEKLGTLELKSTGLMSKHHMLQRGKGRILDESFDDKYFILPEEDIRYYQKKVRIQNN